MAERTESGRLHTWFAEVDDRAVGLASVVLHDLPPRPEEERTLVGHLLHVWVDPAHRRLGIGRALTTACLAAGPELGVRAFSLHATEDGRPLYEQLGFEPVPTWMERPGPPPQGR
nr:GNAT family N-acetyltransferase [Aquihabitans sp. G128]